MMMLVMRSKARKLLKTDTKNPRSKNVTTYFQREGSECFGVLHTGTLKKARMHRIAKKIVKKCRVMKAL